MKEEYPKIAEAFSRKALVYDEFGENHPILERMRRKVRRHALAFLRPGDRILEINAGTGADAAFFASRGFRVHATDLSPGMVAQIQEKRRRLGLQAELSVGQCPFEDLGQIREGPFQLIFSNMGGINCTNDLQGITRQVGGLLSPGGYVTWVVMPPVCPWELALILRGRLKTALRRLSPGGTLANVAGLRFRTYYYTPNRVIRAFGPEFRLVKLQGLSVFTPPADHKDFPSRHPSLYRFLRFLDDRLADRFPFRGWGDFFILTLQHH
jgi:ubiquinone/menaquinone biosynthesis C-methylase UbiE